MMPKEKCTRLCDRCGKYEFLWGVPSQDTCVFSGLKCIYSNKFIEEKKAGESFHGDDVWIYEPKEETSDHESAKGHENDHESAAGHANDEVNVKVPEAKRRRP